MPDLTARLTDLEGEVIGSLSLTVQDYLRIPQGSRTLQLQLRCPNLQGIKCPAAANRTIEDVGDKEAALEKAELLGLPLRGKSDDENNTECDSDEENWGKYEITRLDCQAGSPVGVFVDCFCGKCTPACMTTRYMYMQVHVSMN